MMKGRVSMFRGREAYESPRETLLPLLADESPGEAEAGARRPASPLLTKWNKTYSRCPDTNADAYTDSPTESVFLLSIHTCPPAPLLLHDCFSFTLISIQKLFA